MADSYAQKRHLNILLILKLKSIYLKAKWSIKNNEVYIRILQTTTDHIAVH